MLTECLRSRRRIVTWLLMGLAPLRLGGYRVRGTGWYGCLVGHPAVSKGRMIANIERVFRFVERRLADDFTARPSAPRIALLLSDSTYSMSELTRLFSVVVPTTDIEAASGLFIPEELLVIVSEPIDKLRFYGVLAHELVHALCYRDMSATRHSNWADEGYAEFASARCCGLDRANMARCLMGYCRETRNGALMGLRELMTRDMAAMQAQHRHLFVMQSALLVDYLVSHQGIHPQLWTIVRRCLTAPEGCDYSGIDELCEIFSSDEQSLEQDFMEFVARVADN